MYFNVSADRFIWHLTPVSNIKHLQRQQSSNKAAKINHTVDLRERQASTAGPNYVYLIELKSTAIKTSLHRHQRKLASHTCLLFISRNLSV